VAQKPASAVAVGGLITALTLIPLSSIEAEAPTGSVVDHIEVGVVRWRRDLDTALEESRRTGKPVFAFFQEVPGCRGCKQFGAEVMSHEPIVEAIEHEFLPVLIYNNRRGKDAEILARYDEPAWNYQVIRFLDGGGRDLIPRKDRVWTRDALAVRMIQALEAADRPVPGFLEATAYEDRPDLQETVAFAQSCFWRGEVMLGRISGVITTEAGWIGGREVTLVRYRPDLVSLETLVDSAVAAGVADKVYLSPDRQRRMVAHKHRLEIGSLPGTYRRARDADQKRQIRGTALATLDLTAMQRTKVNAFVTSDVQRALSWLTPAQLEETERPETRR
jgi:hypothetical protein